MSTHAGAALISRRYAKALFELATGAGAVDAALGNVETLKATCENRNMRALMHNPLIGKETQSKALEALKAPLRLHPLVQQFLNILVENRRLAILPEALEVFIDLAREARGESLVVVSSAKPLDDASRTALKAMLDKKLGKVSLEERVDQSLLAGVVVRKGSKLLDASLKGRLNRLRLAL